MGFASGSYHAETLWERIREYIPRKHWQAAAEEIVSVFEDMDSDDWTIDTDTVYGIARPDEIEPDEEEEE